MLITVAKICNVILLRLNNRDFYKETYQVTVPTDLTLLVMGTGTSQKLK